MSWMPRDAGSAARSEPTCVVAAAPRSHVLLISLWLTNANERASDRTEPVLCRPRDFIPNGRAFDAVPSSPVKHTCGTHLWTCVSVSHWVSHGCFRRTPGLLRSSPKVPPTAGGACRCCRLHRTSGSSFAPPPSRTHPVCQHVPRAAPSDTLVPTAQASSPMSTTVTVRRPLWPLRLVTAQQTGRPSSTQASKDVPSRSEQAASPHASL